VQKTLALVIVLACVSCAEGGVAGESQRRDIFVVGDDGILHSTDRGATRRKISGDSYSERFLRGICGDGQHVLAVVGDNGTILHRASDGN
jgi:hypothetical protein